MDWGYVRKYLVNWLFSIVRGHYDFIIMLKVWVVLWQKLYIKIPRGETRHFRTCVYMNFFLLFWDVWYYPTLNLFFERPVYIIRGSLIAETPRFLPFHRLLELFETIFYNFPPGVRGPEFENRCHREIYHSNFWRYKIKLPGAPSDAR